MSNLSLFLLAVAAILLVAWLWPTKGADEDETMNSQDWRMMDVIEKRKEDDEAQDFDTRR